VDWHDDRSKQTVHIYDEEEVKLIYKKITSQYSNLLNNLLNIMEKEISQLDL
jgi:hypothetical protein